MIIKLTFSLITGQQLSNCWKTNSLGRLRFVIYLWSYILFPLAYNAIRFDQVSLYTWIWNSLICMPPKWNLYLYVAKKNLSHNFGTTRDRDFICGMHKTNETPSNDTKVNDIVSCNLNCDLHNKNSLLELLVHRGALSLVRQCISSFVFYILGVWECFQFFPLQDKQFLVKNLLSEGFPVKPQRVKRVPGSSGRLHKTEDGEWEWSDDELDVNSEEGKEASRMGRVRVVLCIASVVLVRLVSPYYY